MLLTRQVLAFAIVVLLARASGQTTSGQATSNQERWAVDLKNGMAACLAGRYEEARQLLEPAIDSAPIAATDLRRITAIELLAAAYQRLGDMSRASDLYSVVLANADDKTDTGRRQIILAANNLGVIRSEQGRWEQAVPLLEKALVLHSRVFGDDSPMTAVSLQNLGTLYLLQKRWNDAAPLLERAVRIFRSAPPEYGKELLSSLGSLGKIHSHFGRYSLALPLFQEALEAGTQRGGNDPEFADTLVGLGSCYQAQKNDTRAEPLLRKALAIYERAGLMHSSRGANVLSAYGHVRLDEQRYGEAELYFRRAVDILRTAYGVDHICVAALEMNLALACLHLGKYKECDGLLRHGYEIQTRAYRVSVAVAEWLIARAELDARLGYDRQAETHFQEAIAMFEATAGAADAVTGHALLAYADFLKGRRKKDAASIRHRAQAILSLQK